MTGVVRRRPRRGAVAPDRARRILAGSGWELVEAVRVKGALRLNCVVGAGRVPRTLRVEVPHGRDHSDG